MALPTVQRAIVAKAVGKYEMVDTYPLPFLAPYSVVVRVSAVALNPVNWKMIDASPPIGVVGGNDFSGIVSAVGKDVMAREGAGAGAGSSLSVGDEVCGCLYGLDPTLENGQWAGSFAEYVAVDASLVMRIPTVLGVKMSMNDAASLPVGVMTAGMGLYRCLKLPMPKPIESRNEKMEKFSPNAQHYIFIHGGNTATGIIAIQLAKLSGLIPIATCSPSNMSKIEKLGALKAFDYSKASCGTAIRAFTKGQLHHVLDCVSDTDSMRLCYRALGPKGGTYVSLEPPSKAVAATRQNVRTDWVMMLAMFGKEVVMDGDFRTAADFRAYEFAVDWFRAAENLLDRGVLLPHLVRVLPGGLDAVVGGIEELKLGRVRGEKLVYNVITL